MPLNDVEVRVLGSLAEKERTTPDAYPLTSAALLAACNQKTNREPVMDLHLREVEDAVVRLRDRGLAATVQGASDRVPKHRHRLSEQLDVDARELALLAVLMLRGPQTAAELRTRSERYGVRGDLAAVEATLGGLAGRSAPLVRNVGRGPGQSQDRWEEILSGREERLRPRARRPDDSEGTPAEAGGAPSTAQAPGRRERASSEAPDDVWARLRDLEARVAALERRLGDAPSSPREHRREERP